MNWKSTLLLLAAVAAGFAFILFVERPIRQQRLRDASHSILVDFDPAAVTNVVIAPWGGEEISLARSGDASNSWRMTQPLSYPARTEAITNLLNALQNLNWQDRISERELKDRPDAQEKFGFTKPQFSLVLQGAGAPRHLLIGNSSAVGDQVFVYVVGNYDIYLAGADLLGLLPTGKNQWRALSMLHLADLSYQSIHVRSPGKPFDLERDPTNHLWFVNYPLRARADSSKIDQLLARLDNVRVSQFVSDDPQADPELYGLQTSPQTPDLELSFLDGTNIVAGLRVGSSLTNAPAFAYARLLGSSNVVVVARDNLQPWQTAYTNFLDHHLISLPPDMISSITVAGGDSFSVQKQPGAPWQVFSSATFPADDVLMRDWLAAFTNIECQIEKTVVADFADYGLAHPLLQYTLNFAGAGHSNDVMAQIQFGTNQSGQIFERRTDELFVNLISPEDFDRLPHSSWQLRDRRIWNFETTNLLSVTVHQLGGTRKYLRDPDGAWTFAPGYHGPPFVNWTSLEEGMHRLGRLKAVYWSGVGDSNLSQFGFTAMQHDLSLEIRTPAGLETNSIEFGARSIYSHPYASVVKNGERLIFEFPVDLYENFIEPDLTIPAALRYPR